MTRTRATTDEGAAERAADDGAPRTSGSAAPGERVALGVSGGVDSAVAAALLLQAGYQVIGVTCRFLNGEKSDAAEADARAVCAAIGIPHVVISAQELFQSTIIEPFTRSYAEGKTPCPCIECNALCKIPSLLACADKLGCSKVATGHYARIVEYEANGARRFAVKTALDEKKDQSYMLGLLSQEQLARLILPLGGLTKAETRILAQDWQLPVADKQDSQDNCFIEGDYRSFLLEHGVFSQEGSIVNTSGRKLGTHQGLPFYTLGQRKGLGIAAPEPYFVVEKRLKENELVVGFSDEAQISGVLTTCCKWQAAAGFSEALRAFGDEDQLPVRVKLRYRGASLPAFAKELPDGRLEFALLGTSAPTSPGQYAVAYTGSMVLCAAPIEQVLFAPQKPEETAYHNKDTDDGKAARTGKNPLGKPALEKVFIIGGMGSGKSTAAAALAQAGLPCIDLDLIGHEAHALPGVKRALMQRFGEDILSEDGSIKRGTLAAKAFASAEATAALNRIMMRPIARLLDERLKALRNAGVAAVVIEFSAFKERDPLFMGESDLVVAILAPEEQRIARAVAKGWDEAAVRARLAQQVSDEERAAKANICFTNDRTPEALQEDVLKWWHEHSRNN